MTLLKEYIFLVGFIVKSDLSYSDLWVVLWKIDTVANKEDNHLTLVLKAVRLVD
jgi:hypothetical protein